MAVPIPASAYESSTFAPGTMQAGAAAIQARAIQSVTDACTAYQNAAVNAQSAWVAYRMAPLGEPTRQALNAYNGAKDDADLRYQQYLSTKAAVEASYGPLASSCSPPLPSAVPATSNIPTGPMPVPPGITPPSGGLGFRVPPPFGVPTSGPAPAPPVTVPTPVRLPDV